MSLLQENWDLFCSKLKQVRETPNGIEARCPSHNDQTASLTASCNSEKILLKCHTGCSFHSIIKALGMEKRQFFALHPKLVGTDAEEFSSEMATDETGTREENEELRERESGAKKVINLVYQLCQHSGIRAT